MDTLSICIDCAMLHANADTSGIDDEKRLAEVLAGLSQFPFLAVVGDENYFSWSSCDACGTRLGGDRIDAVEIVMA